MNLEHKQNTPPALENLKINLPELGTEENPEISKVTPYKASFNGKILEIEVRAVSNFNEKRFMKILIVASDKSVNDINASSIILELRKNYKDECEAITKVENNQRDLKGLGRALWEMCHGIIQEYSDTTGLPIKHVITRMPSQGLTGEKWNELFLPLLNKYNYTHLYHNIWTRLYLPKKT